MLLQYNQLNSDVKHFAVFVRSVRLVVRYSRGFIQSLLRWWRSKDTDKTMLVCPLERVYKNACMWPEGLDALCITDGHACFCFCE
jgi:hypothetical protein